MGDQGEKEGEGGAENQDSIKVSVGHGCWVLPSDTRGASEVGPEG